MNFLAVSKMDKIKYEAELAKIFPFWDKLEQNEKDKILLNTLTAEYDKGQMLHGGNQCTGLLIVLTGELRVFLLSEEGKEVTLYRLLPGDMCMLSASCVLSTINFDVFITSETNSQCLLINGQTFSALAENNLLVKNFALEKAVARFSDVMWVMQQILFTSLDKRLAGFLLTEAARQNSKCLKFTHEQIAGNLGTAREVVSRLLKYMSTEKIIAMKRGTITILDEEKLKNM